MFFFHFAYANDLDALSLETMAMEALEIFYESRILGNYVSTDFSPEFASPGDTVIATAPSELTADRLPEGGTMNVSDAAAVKYSMKLNQHLYIALPFTDREKIRSQKDLIDFFAAPMARSLAQQYDRAIQGEILQSYLYTAGKLGTDLTYDTVVDAGALQTENYVPVDNRVMVVGPRMGAQLRKNDNFVDRVSLTDPSVVRAGVIGQIGGYLASETNSFFTVGQSTRVTGAVNNVGGYAAGVTAVTVDGFSAAITSGSWCTIDGVPYRIASTTGGATPTVLTLANPLRHAVANDAVVYVYTPALINNADAATEYIAGYEGGIAFDSITPVVGQGVTFGTTGAPYRITKISGGTMWLNRPLDAAAGANDDPIFLMPGGNYGVGISRNSIQVVTRPLPTPNRSVEAAVAIGENFAIRITRDYTQLQAKETIAMDCIMGVANHFPQYNVIFLG